MPSQTSRFCNRLSATIVIRLFGPMHRHRSKIQGYSKGSCGGWAVRRKNKFKPRAAAVGIFSCDRAAMRFNDGSYNGQPHSESFHFCTEERIEQAVPYILRNPDAMITHVCANRAIPV